MNIELIQDENNENPMKYDELYIRMSELLENNWKAMLLFYESDLIGYALYQERRNIFDPTKEEIYLRQYFIKKQFRGRGLGREGIKKLRTEVFSRATTLIIDVLVSNPRGKEFWKKTGFEPYYTNMKLKL